MRILITLEAFNSSHKDSAIPHCHVTASLHYKN